VVFVTDSRTKKYAEGRDDYNLQIVASSTLAGGVFGRFKGFLALVQGYFQSRSIIKKYKPSIAVGFGGYPSLPPMVAAQHRNVITIIHEANAVLGRANAYLASKADRIALSLPNMSSLEDQDIPRAVVTGNPIRSDIAALYAHPYSAPDTDHDFNITVMGGSLGAKVMAENVPHALSKLPEDLKVRLNVTQQCHDEDIQKVREIYTDAGITATLCPFIENMPEVLKKTDLVIARSGASTVSEVCVAGIPAIYIPYPHHVDNQQKINAQSVSKQGGAWVLEEKDLTSASLASRIESLMRSPESLFAAAESARDCAKPEATRKLGNLVIALIKGWD
jgi:UDP-N-acetylglucosamine--N-acetylmuramyl-(pentapeptide) pyrophosphoryl-undecaprenol N-acetylglucosamine transferase